MNTLSQLFGAGAPVEIDALAARSRLAEPSKPLLLDVREPYEFEAGHIAGATLIPLGSLPGRLSELPKDREILVVCRSGARSMTATRHLLSAGFKAVNLRGGMLAWAQASLPVALGTK
ncbi:MAG TPA: rhodanese-like domain-containing protein [Anaerolineales bacterium]|nr:rhodanese-like domain-containing protein [Anaerolineales bacterium]